MDKLKLVRSDGMRGLPPGFRFEPTEEELVFEYLKCKVFGSANLCASIIPEILDVCNFDPWDLPVPGGDGEGDEMRYFFSKRKSKKRSNKCTTPSGYWKATGSDTKIVCSGSGSSVSNYCHWSSSGASVGIKKTLLFYTSPSVSPNNNAKARTRTRTRTWWVMHEYRLQTQTQAQTSTSSRQINTTMMDMEKWVLYRIFCNKPKINININNANYDFMMMDHNRNDHMNMDYQYYYDRNGRRPSTSASSSSSSSSSSASSFTHITSTPMPRDHLHQTTANSHSDDHFSAS